MLTCTKPVLVLPADQIRKMAEEWYDQTTLVQTGDPDNFNRTFEELSEDHQVDVCTCFCMALSTAGISVPKLHDNED